MSWIKQLFSRRRFYRDLSEEMREHLEEKIEELVATGMPAEEARYEAHRQFGNALLWRGRSRDAWGFQWLATLLQDLRYGLRQLRRNPGFTSIAVMTLALGIGANTAIFSLLNALMRRELPVQNPSQLVLLGKGRASGDTEAFAFTDAYSYSFYREMRQKNRVFSDVTALLSVLFGGMHGAVAGSGNLEPMNVQLVSGTYFSMLGVKPILGRAFTEADDEPAGGHPVAVVSYSWWKRRFGCDPFIVGKTVTSCLALIGGRVYVTGRPENQSVSGGIDSINRPSSGKEHFSYSILR